MRIKLEDLKTDDPKGAHQGKPVKTMGYEKARHTRCLYHCTIKFTSSGRRAVQMKAVSSTILRRPVAAGRCPGNMFTSPKGTLHYFVQREPSRTRVHAQFALPQASCVQHFTLDIINSAGVLELGRIRSHG